MCVSSRGFELKLGQLHENNRQAVKSGQSHVHIAAAVDTNEHMLSPSPPDLLTIRPSCCHF